MKTFFYCLFLSMLLSVMQNQLRAGQPGEKKIEQVFSDMKSADPAISNPAKRAFQSYKFTKRDIPLMCRELLVTRAEDTTLDIEVNTRRHLLYSLSKLHDSVAQDFVMENQDKICTTQELKEYYLQCLLYFKTDISFNRFKDCILSKEYRSVNPEIYEIYLTNSPKMTKGILYPGLMSLISDSAWSNSLAKISIELLNNDMIKPREVLPYKEGMLSALRQNFEKKYIIDDKSNKFDWLLSLCDALGYKEAFDIMKQGLPGVKDFGTAFLILKKFVRNGIAIPAQAVNLLASSPKYHNDLYNLLDTNELVNLFPKEYLGQESFARSALHKAMDIDESIVDSVVLYKKLTRNIESVPMNFYMYKIYAVVIMLKGEKNHTFIYGLSGPYPTDEKKIVVEGALTGLDYLTGDSGDSDEKIFDRLKTYLESPHEDEDEYEE